MSRLLPNSKFDHVFAVIRVDKYSIPVQPSDAIIVTKILWSQKDAEKEVARLNQLNSGKNCEYFWQVTRLERQTAALEKD